MRPFVAETPLDAALVLSQSWLFPFGALMLAASCWRVATFQPAANAQPVACTMMCGAVAFDLLFFFDDSASEDQ